LLCALGDLRWPQRDNRSTVVSHDQSVGESMAVIRSLLGQQEPL
jgi:hypothetical protein